MGHELLTAQEAALYLKLKVGTVRTWTCRGRLPFCKLGKAVRYRKADLDSLIESSFHPRQKEDEGQS